MRKRLLTALVALSLFGAIYPATAVRAASDDPCAPAEDGSVPEMCQGGVAYPEMGEGFFFSATFTQLVTAGELSRALFNVESGSITFSNGELSATVGCNNVFGSASLTLGNLSAGVPNTLVLAGPLASTKMYCDGLMETEAALISILEGEFLSLAGDGITSSNGMIRIEGGVPIAMADSVAPGGNNTPFSIDYNGTIFDVTGGYINIAENELSASVGCNTIAGGVRVEGDQVIRDGELISTMMYCEGLMDAESALAAVLNGANLHWAGAYELASDAGVIRIAATLCGDCVMPPVESSDSTGLTLAVLLLFAPIASAAFAISRGLTTKS
ncbi:MAG: META domain-containing protein [Candidatus Limnocylindrus sp. ZSMar2m-chloro-G89]|nr:MAG: META domain-containing protein [Candidatus Limnocylindrus sp. ZSMar2m-chloro-G89]